MTTQYTPGSWQIAKGANNWSVDRDTLGSTESVAICDDDGKIVAFAVDYSNKAFADLNTDHARLIAAAPDLLVALERALDLGFDEEGAAWFNWRDQAFAAIKKAIGE